MTTAKTMRQVAALDGGRTTRWGEPLPAVARFRECVHEQCVPDGTEIGDTVECEKCANLPQHIERLRDYVQNSGEYSHTTMRSTAANRCRAWSSYFVYRVDKTSPSGVMLAFDMPACDEIAAVLKELGTRAQPGPTRGELAMR